MSGKTSLRGQKNAWQTEEQVGLEGAGTHVLAVLLPPKGVPKQLLCVPCSPVWT